MDATGEWKVGLLLMVSVYRADVSNDANNDKKFYFGLADPPLKER